MQGVVPEPPQQQSPPPSLVPACGRCVACPSTPCEAAVLVGVAVSAGPGLVVVLEGEEGEGEVEEVVLGMSAAPAPPLRTVVSVSAEWSVCVSPQGVGGAVPRPR